MTSRQMLFYDVGDLTFDEQIRSLVSASVESVVEEVFETGNLFLDFDEGAVSFDFTDNDCELRKSFSMSDVLFCGVEDDKQAVIAALEALIQRVKDS